MKLDAIRKALFTPCKSKEELDRWIRLFLQIRLPDRIVSDESNASPLDVLWQLYDRAVRNDVEGWQRSMTYASRFSGKTLAASILELMIVLHTDRNIVHMAAIVDQAKKAQEYVKGFFERQYIRDFVKGDNAKEVIVVRYIHKKTGVPLTEAEFDKSGASIEDFIRKENYIRIIACTMQSTNGQHVEFMVVDEVDVIEKKNIRAYHQAKGGVPTARNGMEAMTLFTSTRKSRVGLVQQEIDNAETVDAEGNKIVKLKLNHWNIIDITEPCTPARHLPEEPKRTYWINDALVSHISDDKYQALPEAEKSKWYAREGFAGCATCPLFAACKSRLATHQEGKTGSFENGGTALLLPIREVISKFQGATPEFITTEYMCFASGAEILMEGGLSKPIQDIKVGDKVIAHTGKVRSVTATMQNDYFGPMQSLQLPTRNKHHSPLISTPLHPFFVNGSEFKEANKLVGWKFDKWGGNPTGGDYYSFPQYFEPEISEIDLKDYAEESEKINSQKVKLDANFGWILGYFLAEGCVIKWKGKYKNITFSSDARELEYHEAVRKWFGKVYEHRTSSKHGYVQVINSAKWARIMHGLCGRWSHQKHLHPSLLKTPLEFQRAILNGFDAGDGTKNTQGYKELTTTSWQLANQLSLIASRLGLCPRIQVLKPKTRGKQAYRVVFQDSPPKQDRTKFKIADEYNQYRIDFDDIQTIDYWRGPVFNFEVEGDNSYIVNGVAVHNCRKPDTSGLVYPRLQEEIHQKTAAQIAEIVTGEPQNPALTREELLALLVNKGARFVSGMDFGYNHMFAVTTAAIWGQMAFVVDAVGRSHMERDDQLNETEHLKALNSQIYPDPEDAGAIATFKRKGYRVKEWSKNAGSVKAGIEIVRAKLWTKGPGATLFFLKGDPNIDLLYKHVRDYRFTTDAAGQFTEIPDEENDDYPDSLRYAIMNIFGKDGGLRNNTGLAPVSEAVKEEHWTEKVKRMNDSALNNIVAGLTGTVTTSDGMTTVAPKKIKKPGFFFDG